MAKVILQKLRALISYDNNGNEVIGSKLGTISFSQDNLLHLNDNFRISRYNRNFNNGERQYVSTRKASIFSTSIANTIFLNNAALFLKPAYNGTINILDSQKDLNSLASNESRGEFDIFKFYGNYNKRFQISYLKTSISYNISFDIQASQQTLNGNGKFL